MKIKKQLFKRLLILSSILLIGVLTITACGTFSFQGSVQPNAEGGVDITGGSQPNTASQPGSAQGMDQTTLILIIVGAVVLILILIMLVSRRSSGNAPPE